jgi:signal transduction histidine kinase
LVYLCDAPAGSTYARADPDKLRQILINLLSNAVKFTPKGGRIRLSCTFKGESVSIHVEDNGPGIPSNKQALVFEPFVQLDRGLTRANEGTGLGLAISRGLARGMGGDLELRSEVNVGSVFTVTIPLSPRV